MKLEKLLPRAASVIAVTSLVSFWASRKRGTGAHSLVSLLIMIAVPTPQLGWQPQESEPHCDSLPLTISAKPANVLMKEIGNQSRVGSILPTCWLTSFAKVRERVALAQTALGSNVFVAAGEGNRLEADERNFLRVLHGELHDRAHLVVVHVVDDGYHQHDFDARFVHVFDGA